MMALASANPINWVLIVVAAILIGFVLNGRRMGFIRTVFTLFSTIIAIMLTIWVSPIISKEAQKNEKLMDFTTKKIQKIIDYEEKENKDDKVTDQVSFIGKLPLPKAMRESLVENNNKEVYKAMAVDNFKEYVSQSVSRMVINAGAFLVVFIIVSIALSVICIALEILSKLPLINGLNKTAGLLAGLLQGIVVVWVLFLVLTVFAGTEGGQKVFQMINDSTFLSVLYNNNMLLKFITNLGQVLLS